MKRRPLSVKARTWTFPVEGEEKTAGVERSGEGKRNLKGRGKEIVEGDEAARAMEESSRANRLLTTLRRRPEEGSELA